MGTVTKMESLKNLSKNGLAFRPKDLTILGSAAVAIFLKKPFFVPDLKVKVISTDLIS